MGDSFADFAIDPFDFCKLLHKIVSDQLTRLRIRRIVNELSLGATEIGDKIVLSKYNEPSLSKFYFNNIHSFFSMCMQDY